MKSGLDYFPLDVHLDEKFELIEAEFGLTGFAVVVKLLQRIYGQQGYYCEWTKEVALLFGRACGLGGNVVSEIVEAAIRRGIFDKALYDRYHILTSAGIQKRYLEAVSRRKSASVEERYLLLCNTQNFENVNISSENVCNFEKNVYISEQRKEEKSKEKKSKENIYGDGGDNPAYADDDTLSRFKGRLATAWREYVGSDGTDYELNAICDMVRLITGVDITISDDDVEIAEYIISAAAKAGSTNIAYMRGVARKLRSRGIKDADSLWEYEAKRDMGGI